MLEKHLSDVRKNLLGGREPTAELRAFWDCWLKNKEDAFFYNDEYYPFSLVSKEPETVHHYLSCADSEIWEAMFKEISWIGEEEDGGLIGYFHQGAGTLDNAPVIYLSNEGCFDLAGKNIVDYFAWAKCYKDLEALYEFCNNYHLKKPLGREEHKDSIKDFKSPEVRFEEITGEINNKKEKSSLVRPVDTYPITLKLHNGLVIIISSEDSVTKSAYDANASFIFDPSTDSFSLIPETPFKMYINTKGVGCLKNGRAVFVKFTNGCRIVVFDPASGGWRPGTELDGYAKVEGIAPALLPNGRVVIAGGYKYRNTYFDKIYTYTIDEDKWSEAGRLSKARKQSAAVSLPDGRVLFLGGEYLKEGDSFPSETDECDIFDPADNTCNTISPVPEPIRFPHALLLFSGKVLLVGNDNQYTLYDPENDRWSGIIKNNMVTMSFVQIDSDKLAFFQHNSKVALLDLGTHEFSDHGSTLLPRGGSTPVLLSDGRILLTGGNLFHNIACEPEIWNPTTGKGQPIPGFEKKMEKQIRDLQKQRDKE